MKRSLGIVACLVVAGAVAAAVPVAPSLTASGQPLVTAGPTEAVPPPEKEGPDDPFDGPKEPPDADGKGGMTCCFN